jgi:hypothetical protein
MHHHHNLRGYSFVLFLRCVFLNLLAGSFILLGSCLATIDSKAEARQVPVSVRNYSAPPMQLSGDEFVTTHKLLLGDGYLVVDKKWGYDKYQAGVVAPADRRFSRLQRLDLDGTPQWTSVFAGRLFRFDDDNGRLTIIMFQRARAVDDIDPREPCDVATRCLNSGDRHLEGVYTVFQCDLVGCDEGRRFEAGVFDVAQDANGYWALEFEFAGIHYHADGPQRPSKTILKHYSFGQAAPGQTIDPQEVTGINEESRGFIRVFAIDAEFSTGRIFGQANVYTNGKFDEVNGITPIYEITLSGLRKLISVASFGDYDFTLFNCISIKVLNGGSAVCLGTEALWDRSHRLVVWQADGRFRAYAKDDRGGCILDEPDWQVLVRKVKRNDAESILYPKVFADGRIWLVNESWETCELKIQ